MKHARRDYDGIQDTTAAMQLAELVLSMNMATDKGLVARRLAREVLCIDDACNAPAASPITTNGTTRLIPRDEPVFLIRGQDAVGAATVRSMGRPCRAPRRVERHRGNCPRPRGKDGLLAEEEDR